MKHLLIFYLAATAAKYARASSSSTSSSSSSSARDALEAARYGPLPPTVFAPGGRLHGVERVAREAYPVGEDDLACVVFGLRCGRRRSRRDASVSFSSSHQRQPQITRKLEVHKQYLVDESNQISSITVDKNHNNDDDIIEEGLGEGDEEFAIMVGIGALSPFLHRDESYYPSEKTSTVGETSPAPTKISDRSGRQNYIPLVINQNDYAATALTTTQAAPIAILSPTLITGTGGKGIDSAILLRRSIEVALSMYRSDNGGVEWFISHSMEGTAFAPEPIIGVGDGVGVGAGEMVTSNNERNKLEESLLAMEGVKPLGGAAGVEVAALVRRLADIAQGCTQSLGGRYGRMLSSSLIAIGTRGSQTSTITTPDGNIFDNDNKNDNKLALWRVDPTGQFWQLDASAVGRGAADIEAELLKRVKCWMMRDSKQSSDDEGKISEKASPEDEEMCDPASIISNKNAKAYLASLSIEEALEVAIDCLVDGIMSKFKTMRTGAPFSLEKERKQYELGLRKRIQAVVVRSNSGRNLGQDFLPPCSVELVCVS